MAMGFSRDGIDVSHSAGVVHTGVCAGKYAHRCESSLRCGVKALKQSLFGFFTGFAKMGLAIHPSIGHCAAFALQHKRVVVAQRGANVLHHSPLDEDVHHLVVPRTPGVLDEHRFQENRLFHLRKRRVSNASATMAARKKYHASRSPAMCCSTNRLIWLVG